jgi:7,8-dihydro-6-hydroxymethylpterin-pyrophosphokinase
MTRRTIAYLSIGSNIRPQKNIPACLKKIRKTFRLRKVSSIYETTPVRLRIPLPSPPKEEKAGVRGIKNFWNLVVQIDSSLSRLGLRRALRGIESDLGRIRKGSKYAPRPIDIDLVIYGDWLRTGFQRMAFVLFPLAEIAPRLKPCRSRRSLAQRARSFRDPEQKIRKLGKRVL